MTRMVIHVIGVPACWFVAAASGLPFPSHAPQPPTPELVQSWLDKSWLESRTFPAAHPIRVEVTSEYHDVPPTSVLDRLRREVPGHPDHPDRNHLPAYEARLAGKFDRAIVTYWYDPATGIRRHNRTYEGIGATTYFDTGIGTDVMWRLMDEQLVIVSVSRPDPMYDFPVLLGGEINDLHVALSGGLFSGAGHLPPPLVELHDQTSWTATSEDPKQQITFEARGTWDDTHGVGVLAQVVMRCGDQANPFTLKYVCTGHRFLEGIGRWTPERIELWKADSVPLRLYSIYTSIDATSVDSSEIKPLVALPAMDGTDPIRGALTFSSTLDLRPGERAFKNRNDQGGITVLPLAQTPEFKHYSRLRRFGWISAALITCSLVAIRVRRWNQNRIRNGENQQ